jgi:glycosyltransferase 2 family protein
MKKQLLLWIGVAVSLVLLWLTLRDVDFARLGGQLARANYGWLIPALACHLLFVATRSERWRVLMGRDRVEFGDAFWVTSIGYLISNVVPLRIGDAARAVLIDRRCHVGIPRAFSTVVVERILDMLTILLELALLIPFMQLPPQALGWVRLFGALSLAAVLVIAVLLTQRQWTERLLMAVLARLPGVAPDPWMGRWRNLISGFDALSSPRSVLIVVGWSLVTWTMMTGIFWALLQAFFPGASPVPAAFLVCAEAFGWVVPASPGNWGVFDKIAREALVGPFGYPLEPAVGYALVTHFFSYLVANILGAMGLMRYSLSLGEISAEAQKATASGEGK